MKRITTILPLFLFSMLLFAQEPATNTLEAQFTDAIEKSNRFEDYKVVKIYKLNNLRKNVFDSIASLEETITTSENEINKQAQEIESLKASLAQTNSDLTVSREKEDGISLFGNVIKKSSYNTMLFSIIGLLLLALVFVFFKFKNSNSITKEAKLKLAETETEFEGHRQRSLEREQQLRRKLQDEINKQK